VLSDTQLTTLAKASLEAPRVLNSDGVKSVEFSVEGTTVLMDDMLARLLEDPAFSLVREWKWLRMQGERVDAKWKEKRRRRAQ
jgi:hypothetical protein